MDSSITIQEHRHSFWKKGTIVSAICCVIFFTVYWNVGDAFWSGILRLGAFVFFALAVLGYLKLMDGPLRITLKATEELLMVLYQKKDKTIQKEEFERKKISRVIPFNPDKNAIKAIIEPDASTFKISFSDSDRDICLFEFGGRPLLFKPNDQTRITRFLGDLEINQPNKK